MAMRQLLLQCDGAVEIVCRYRCLFQLVLVVGGHGLATGPGGRGFSGGCRAFLQHKKKMKVFFLHFHLVSHHFPILYPYGRILRQEFKQRYFFAAVKLCFYVGNDSHLQQLAFA